MNRFFILVLLFAVSFNVGCGEHDHEENNHDHNNHDHNNHDGEEHVCVHFESGPNVSVMGANAATETLSESFEEHTRIDVTFAADSDIAYLKWTPEESGDFTFWLSKDVPVALMDGTTELSAEDSGGAAKGCESLAVSHHTFDVEAKSYVLKIGPATAGATLNFTAEHGDH